MFAVKLANFSTFTVSEENTVKCLEGSSDTVGNGRISSLVFGNLKNGPKPLDVLNKIILAFLGQILHLSGKIYCFKECFTVSVKMPKI